MRVCVGIVTYNSADDLPACIHALRAQTLAPLAIVALDNASSDDTVAWLHTHAPEVIVTRSRVNLGYGRGHNRLIDLCDDMHTYDYYLTLNPDVRLEPDYIAQLVAGMSAHDAGWGTGALRLTDADSDTDMLYSVGHGILRDGYAFNIGYGLPYRPHPLSSSGRGLPLASPGQGAALPLPGGASEGITAVFGAPGAAALYSRALIDDLRTDGAFFDPDLFLYYEDVDVDWRAQARGWRCVSVPGAVAWHRGSKPGGALRMQALANRYSVAVKNATRRELWLNHMPRLALHVVARLLLTPRQGITFVRHLRRTLPRLWTKRADLPHHPLHDWVRWSADQPTGQPRSLMQRWRSFRARGQQKRTAD